MFNSVSFKARAHLLKLLGDELIGDDRLAIFELVKNAYDADAKNHMAEPNSLGAALKTIRKARGLSQEAFSGVSSRTYLSSLERGVKNLALIKLDELCRVMKIHPLTLLALVYAEGDTDKVERVLWQARLELKDLLSGEMQ